jgi:hypothetical protein
MFFVLIFVIILHITSCIWIVVVTLLDEEIPNNWLRVNGYVHLDDIELYIVSYYYTVQTITTVGYGDNSGKNTAERIVSGVIMLTGVFGFTYASGSLASIMNNLDAHSANLKQKKETLDTILDDHKLPPYLISELRNSIKYNVV